MDNAEKLAKLIESAERILVTSHISPDPDAVCSVLLMGTALKLNFPDKSVDIVMEEESTDFSFIDAYGQLKIQPILEAVEQIKPDLLILLDGNNFERASRHDGVKVRELVRQNSIKTIVIDHHEKIGKDNTDLYINDNYPATAQNVYVLLFKSLHLKKPAGFAQTTMTGLFADTGGFVYIKDGVHNEVFTLANELVGAGADIELVKNQLSQFEDGDMKILSELAANLDHGSDYSYSFISDKTVSDWIAAGNLQISLQRPMGNFLDEYIRNIGGRKWGYVVYKNTLQGDNFYSVSLRAVSGVKDVSVIANRLGGGGHKPAAGAKFEATNVNQALEKVKTAITGAVDED